MTLKKAITKYLQNLFALGLLLKYQDLHQSLRVVVGVAIARRESIGRPPRLRSAVVDALAASGESKDAPGDVMFITAVK